MKLKHIHFLSKLSIKGNKNSGTITLLICLLVVAVTIISCFSVTTANSMNQYKEDYKARALYLDPGLTALTDEALKAISSVEHVEVVADMVGLKGYFTYEILETDHKELSEKAKSTGNHLTVYGLYEGEEKSVIKGQSLEKAPAFSCLVPSIFYPFEDAFESDFKNLDYIDGTSLIGKTITVRGYNGNIEFSYYSQGADGHNNYNCRNLPSPEFTLTVVGTYPCSYSNSGSYMTLYVSRETDLLMAEMAFENAGIDLSNKDDSLAQWWNTPSLHEYFVVVDEYDNIPEVFNTVRGEMGYSLTSIPEKEPDDTMVLMSTVFKVAGTFLILSIMFISVFILVQSSVNSMRERKGFIGLMKAIGYKNRQIFFSLIYEQLYMTMRAFLIGGAISTLVVFFANLKFEHGTYRQMQYIISWNTFGFFLLIAFLIAFLVPLVTELLLLNKLVKIEPREAMTTR